MHAFFELLSRFIPVDEALQNAFSSKSKLVSYEKGDFFAHPDRICRDIGFLNSGVFRVYHLHEGKDITDYFNTPARNAVVSSFKSFLKNEASSTYVEALLPCEVLLISYDDLQQLYQAYPQLERAGRLLAEYNYLLAMNRIEALQYHSAKQRYENFLQQYHGLLNSIPQHYIASYIGVTPESLSRIRKTLVRA